MRYIYIFFVVQRKGFTVVVFFCITIILFLCTLLEKTNKQKKTHHQVELQFDYFYHTFKLTVFKDSHLTSHTLIISHSAHDCSGFETSSLILYSVVSEKDMLIICFIYQGKKNNSFRECYFGGQRHYKLTHLCPAMAYTFRVAARNDIGIRYQCYITCN